MNKQDILFHIESKNNCIVGASQPTCPSEKPKKFVTFPYAYMNGCLHLGHASTIQNADMQARFYQLCGYNVLFPFGFHGSGMPIVASAQKLKRELEKVDIITKEYIATLQQSNQLRILYEMGIDIELFPKFIDPYFWIVYFSEKAKTDVLTMNPFIDFTRSFCTTDLNPYYDSFIQWQFNHLMTKGLVYKGTRNIIYSELDSQPCADHDRAIGENVNPIKINAFYYNGVLVTVACDPLVKTKKIVYCENPDVVYVSVLFNKKQCVMSKSAYLNIKHQFPESIVFIQNVSWNDLDPCFSKYQYDSGLNWGTGFYMINDDNSYDKTFSSCNLGSNIKIICDNYEIFEYYEPESRVVSRSGDICVVATTEQWFIDYGNVELKAKVLDYVRNKFTSPTHTVKGAIESAVLVMHEKACSRNFGLGTKLPGTNDIIDSLSDSTIYMAYYTIAHLITHIPIEQVTHKLWDYIFLGKDEPPTDFYDIVIAMRKEFEYWYPVDIRVSGKDLVPSHLTYALFNHMAIWDNPKYMPKSYYVNGHLMLNGEKMSKSTGNFLTLEECTKKYGSNAMRFALACNDGIDDGNFTDANVNTGILKLANELQFIQDNASIINSEKFCNITQYEYFEHQIKEIIKSVHNSYSNATYSLVIKAFYALISEKEEYCRRSKSVEGNMIKLYTQALYTVMYPICPTWTEEIRFVVEGCGLQIDVNWYIDYSNPHIVKYKFYNDVVKGVKAEISRLVTAKDKQVAKGGNPNVKFLVEVIRNFTEEERLVISNMNDLQTFYSQVEDKKKMGSYKGFARHISNHIEEYGELWLTWVNSSTLDEYNYVSSEISGINCKYPIEVISIDSNIDYQFRNNPGKPKVVQIEI